MRRALAALAAVLVCAPAAAAHYSKTSRTHNIRHVAVSVYGPNVCGDTMTVPIRRKATLFRHKAIAEAWHDGTLDAPLPYTGCSINVLDRSWTTYRLCIAVSGHEYGHLAGLRFPDNPSDPVHSPDPSNVMFASGTDWWEPCDRIRQIASLYPPPAPG